MKKILSMVVVFGFVLMIGAAGGADLSGAGLVTAFLLEILGMAMIFFGTSAIMNYKRYLRRNVILRRKNGACQKMRCRVAGIEKELC